MADQEAAPQGKKKLIIIILIGLIVLGGGGAAAWFFFLSGDESTEMEDVAEMAPALPTGPALYINLPQPFIFNVTGDRQDRLVQIKVQLMTRGDQNEEIANLHTPLIESSLLSTFGAATVEQLRTPRGRIELRDQAQGDIQAAFTKLTGKPVIEKVLFTDFVMQ